MSAKFKARWFELDIGWIYIRALKLFGLAKIEYARNYGSAEKRIINTLMIRGHRPYCSFVIVTRSVVASGSAGRRARSSWISATACAFSPRRA